MFTKNDYSSFEKALCRMLKAQFYKFKEEVCIVLVGHAKEGEMRDEEIRKEEEHTKHN